MIKISRRIQNNNIFLVNDLYIVIDSGISFNKKWDKLN